MLTPPPPGTGLQWDGLRTQGLAVWESLSACRSVIRTVLILFSCSSLQKEKQTLSEELHALRKENKLLKENNAVINRRREHYICEIKRLHKVLGRLGGAAWRAGLYEASPGEAHMDCTAGGFRARTQGHLCDIIHLSSLRGSAGYGHEALGMERNEEF